MDYLEKQTESWYIWSPLGSNSVYLYLAYIHLDRFWFVLTLLFSPTMPAEVRIHCALYATNFCTFCTVGKKGGESHLYFITTKTHLVHVKIICFCFLLFYVFVFCFCFLFFVFLFLLALVYFCCLVVNNVSKTMLSIVFVLLLWSQFN